MSEKNKFTNILLIILIVSIISIFTYFLFSKKESEKIDTLNYETTINNPTIDIRKNSTTEVVSIPVGTFYNGKEGFSLSIPSGNESTCIWNSTGGSAAIPYIETTGAKSATEKHTVYSYDHYNWKVTCVDDFGNQYIGVFPK